MNSSDSTVFRPTGMQAMMAYWERLHAVNAVHVAELSCSLCPQRLQMAVERLFGKFRAADSQGRWPALSTNGGLCGGEVLAEFHLLPNTSKHPLDALVTDLLNRPFSESEPPFRVDFAEGNEKRYLLLSYRHSISDGRSIALLLQNLLEELHWEGPGDLPLQIKRETRTLSELFPKESRRASPLRSVGFSTKTMLALDRCHRRPPSDPSAFRMSFQFHSEHLSLASLRQQSLSWKATVGELLLASMLEFFLDKDRLQGCPLWSPNRCVSTVVDLTARAEVKHPLLFGHFVSPLNVIANHRQHKSFQDLLCQVQAVSRPHDAITNSLRSLRGLALNAFLISRLARPFANWYQEFLFPVSGALSNVNRRNMLPPARTPLPIVNYLRGACATQFSPMILCLTTMQDTCTLTTTHRDAVYSAEEMRGLAQHVMLRAFGVESATDLHDATPAVVGQHNSKT